MPVFLSTTVRVLCSIYFMDLEQKCNKKKQKAFVTKISINKNKIALVCSICCKLLMRKLKRSERSSHQMCSVRKCFLTNFAKFTGQHLCQSLFFNKIGGRGLKKTLVHLFSCKFQKFLKTPFLHNTSRRLLLESDVGLVSLRWANDSAQLSSVFINSFQGQFTYLYKQIIFLLAMYSSEFNS